MAAVAVLVLIVVLAGHQRAVGRHVRALSGTLHRLGDGEQGLRVPEAGPMSCACWPAASMR